MILAPGAAVVGALAYGTGSVLQAVAARRATGTAVLRQPAYVIGTACDVVAFAASLVAVQGLPLFAVQSVLAASLGVTVVLARLVLGTPIRRRDAAALVAVVAALGVLALACGQQAALPAPSWFTGAMVLATVVLGVTLALQYGTGSSPRLAVLAGACFSGSAIGARALDLTGGVLGVVDRPLAWTVVGFGIVGSLAYARSLERGAAGPATATGWVVEVLVSGVVGIAVLGDHVLPGWSLPALAALVVAVLGCVSLAQAQPDEPTPVPTSGRRAGSGTGGDRTDRAGTLRRASSP